MEPFTIMCFNYTWCWEEEKVVFSLQNCNKKKVILMSRSLHSSNKMQLTIMPNIKFCFKNLWILAKSLPMCPYLWILDRVINTKVIHPNIATFSSNIWSFKGVFLGDLYLKQTWLQKQSPGIRSAPVYLNGILSSYILSEILYNAESQSILEFSKGTSNLSILCLSFITKMDLFRVMPLTLLLCKMAFSCINPHMNTECYSVMLSHSVKEIAPELMAAVPLAWLLKRIKC